MAVSEAIENYLETIYILSKKQNEVHAIDICSYLSYSRPTVSIVLRQMLGVSRENAQHDACKIEHDLSDETFEAIKAHMEKYRNMQSLQP